MSNEEQECSICKTPKSLRDFHKNKNRQNGHTTICKPCAITKSNAWVRENRERAKTTRRSTYARTADVRRTKNQAWRDANREIDRAYKRKWYEVNKEKALNAARIWHLANPDTVKETQRRWHENHPGLAVKRNKEWRKNNRARSNSFSKKWALANPESVKARQQRWASENKLKCCLYQHERRKRKAKAAGTSSEVQVIARLALWGFNCWLCQKPYQAVDHVIPLAKGGTNWPANLRPACKSCNSSKGAKHPSQIRRSTTITPCPLPG